MSQRLTAVLRRSCLAAVPLLLASSLAAAPPATVDEALESAGRNRAELEAVLDHYLAEGDEQKIAAAEFLIANMGEHGFKLTVLQDAGGIEVSFNARNHRNLKEAQAVLDALEDEYGTVEFGSKNFDRDLETISAGYLIENIDLAFDAWRTKPWAEDVSFENFCEYILPYRGSNEPLGWWRRPNLDRFADLTDELEDPTDPLAAGRKISKDVSGLVKFRELYYLHPTDQSYEEMIDRGAGRCEDISNMMGYSMRANAVMSATDYTPWWANRDNNHAWEVILDASGHGSAKLSHRAAKVYRKTYSIQRDSLGFIKTEEEDVPRWLGGTNFRDVTSQYMETSNVSVPITEPIPEDHRFAYVCVFNGGEWRAIHWGRIEDDRAEFTRMGRRIVYLPAFYVDGELVPAAPPFLLGADGEARPQVPLSESTFRLELTPKGDGKAEPPQVTTHPVVRVAPGGTYHLFVWADGGWVSRGRRRVMAKPVAFNKVPEGVLLWLVNVDGKRMERPFTIEDGKRRSW
ncbi:MAG: transglutaminase domain-containing protein [Planctomycetes bacterium]|nr:transglutaminase domain-containing protein [Planctomycetota bacterium]